MPKYAKLTIHLASQRGLSGGPAFPRFRRSWAFRYQGVPTSIPRGGPIKREQTACKARPGRAPAGERAISTSRSREVVFYRFEGGPLPAGRTDDPAVGAGGADQLLRQEPDWPPSSGSDEDRIEITIRG